MEWLEDSITIMGSPVLYMDIMALAWFALAWFGYGQFADANYRRRLNLIRIMDEMRTRWMHQILKRDSRISDATLVGNIVRSILFYASTSILVLLGLFTVMGSQTAGLTVLRAIPFAVGATPLMFDVKISLMVLIFIYVFFKLSWSVRQYNYVNIIIGAAPMPHEGKHHHFDYAERAGKLVGNAGRHFNMGLRGYYFGLAGVTWFLNGLIFMAVTTLVVYVIYRREFRSHTVNNLVAIDDI